MLDTSLVHKGIIPLFTGERKGGLFDDIPPTYNNKGWSWLTSYQLVYNINYIWYNTNFKGLETNNSKGWGINSSFGWCILFYNDVLYLCNK